MAPPAPSGRRGPWSLDPADVHVWVVASLVPEGAGGVAAEASRVEGTAAATASTPRETTETVHTRRREVAQLALRAVLGAVLDLDPRELRFTAGPAGKPELSPAAEVAFNLAHSGDLAAIAVARRTAVGVDLEARDRRPSPGLARRVLTEAEHRRLQAAAEHERPALFLRFWTMKEACVKAQGVGITDAMDRIEVSGIAGDEPTLAGADGGPWAARWFEAGPGATGAVVAHGGPLLVRTHRAADLAALRRALHEPTMRGPVSAATQPR